MKHQKNRERYSLLMAISNKKIESYKIIKGSIDSNIYLDFYKKIIKYSNLERYIKIMQEYIMQK
jgi:hypothetical protein